jgi:hypothetical protein
MTSEEQTDAAVEAISRLTGLAANLPPQSKLSDIGIERGLMAVLPRVIDDVLRERGVAVDTSKLQFSRSATVQKVITEIGKLKPAKVQLTRRSLANPVVQQIIRDVIGVVARYKGVDARLVALPDLLTRWRYDLADRRNLAQILNLYYYNVRRMVMSPWIAPFETAPASTTVGMVASIVVAHRPTPMPGGFAQLPWGKHPAHFRRVSSLPGSGKRRRDQRKTTNRRRTR